MMRILVKKATILSPTNKYHLKKKDIFIKNGIIEKIADSIDNKIVDSKKLLIIDKKNTFISIGWLDIFSDFCDPGFEHKEDLISGSKSAAAGGYTDICLIPNTKPYTTSKSSVDYIKSKSHFINLHPIGAISEKLEGKDLAEMYDMKLNGAVAFSDGIKPVQESGLLLKALQYVKAFQGVVVQIPEDYSIAKNGLMNEGIISTKLGIQGKPSIAESIQIQRDIELANYTESHIHFTGVSTKKSLALIKQAKKQGIQVTCSVTPYHLFYTDQLLENYDSVFKVNPPLRNEEDRLALVKGIEDGTIDCIATHHFPQDWDAKEVEFEYAKPGMIGLQTTLAILLKACQDISIDKLISLITEQPRKILGLEIPEIKEKEKACLTIFNTDEEWQFNEASNLSKSNNSPLYNQTLKGKVLMVINNNLIHINE